ncbi:MAG: PQQ-dependent sugar dehydrogenase [Isosphaeraceae bacterium]|nr:PQQ-dependent sugar dehydrogenase [Isosphaeraceae bacterium]
MTALLAVALVFGREDVRGQVVPTVLDPNLTVRTVVSGLTQPTTMAFLGPDDFLVLEKSTGRVKRVIGGVAQADPVIDLAVNSASERGLLGIALHPDFPNTPWVYLYWTCSAAPPPMDFPFFPTALRCPDEPALGADTNNILAVPLLGNRLDRFVWDGTTLTFDKNLIMLHTFQYDGAPIPPGQGDQNQGPAGNHNGGVLRFGPDGKLYLIFGDNGRRGWMQNLRRGPTPPEDDDQFGGPAPDDFHLSGVILRLNDDGSTPEDNPFFQVGARIGGDVGANIQKVFSYGRRNSFGMDFDPQSGALWIEENGDDTFDEVSRVEAGDNGGWVQIMGPVQRVAQFKLMETTFDGMNLQQLRWPPTNIANTPRQALSRLFQLPGSRYRDPQFSWRWAVAPAAIGFLNSNALGAEYEGDLFVGEARTTLLGGYLFRFKLTRNRQAIAVFDRRLRDRVADNFEKFDITESETLLFGFGFGIGTDIRTGPNGHLYVVSNSSGAVYEILPRTP